MSGIWIPVDGSRKYPYPDNFFNLLSEGVGKYKTGNDGDGDDVYKIKVPISKEEAPFYSGEQRAALTKSIDAAYKNVSAALAKINLKQISNEKEELNIEQIKSKIREQIFQIYNEVRNSETTALKKILDISKENNFPTPPSLNESWSGYLKIINEAISGKELFRNQVRTIQDKINAINDFYGDKDESRVAMEKIFNRILNAKAKTGDEVLDTFTLVGAQKIKSMGQSILEKNDFSNSEEEMKLILQELLTGLLQSSISEIYHDYKNEIEKQKETNIDFNINDFGKQKIPELFDISFQKLYDELEQKIQTLSKDEDLRTIQLESLKNLSLKEVKDKNTGKIKVKIKTESSNKFGSLEEATSAIAKKAIISMAAQKQSGRLAPDDVIHIYASINDAQVKDTISQAANNIVSGVTNNMGADKRKKEREKILGALQNNIEGLTEIKEGGEAIAAMVRESTKNIGEFFKKGKKRLDVHGVARAIDNLFDENFFNELIQNSDDQSAFKKDLGFLVAQGVAERKLNSLKKEESSIGALNKMNQAMELLSYYNSIRMFNSTWSGHAAINVLKTQMYFPLSYMLQQQLLQIDGEESDIENSVDVGISGEHSGSQKATLSDSNLEPETWKTNAAFINRFRPRIVMKIKIGNIIKEQIIGD